MADYDSRTALIVVDVQNDFADPEGSLYVPGGETVVGSVNAEVVRALAAGGFVVYTQDWHPESTPHFQKDGGVWPVHCVMDTWGADFHPRLLLAGPVVRKGSNGEDGYSGFTMRHPTNGEEIPTALGEMLRGRGVERVVVVGLALDYCVKATALDAQASGHSTTVLEAATAAVNLDPADGDKALSELRRAGVEVG
jgi:nicotinamidase/pyrazinamidase